MSYLVKGKVYSRVEAVGPQVVNKKQLVYLGVSNNGLPVFAEIGNAFQLAFGLIKSVVTNELIEKVNSGIESKTIKVYEIEGDISLNLAYSPSDKKGNIEGILLDEEMVSNLIDYSAMYLNFTIDENSTQMVKVNLGI